MHETTRARESEDDIMTSRERTNGRGGLRPAGLAGLCILAVALAGCGDLLTPENPGEILAEDLRDPKALPILLNGVAGEFAYTYSYAAVTVGHFANELWHTGSQGGWRELNRGIADPSGQLGTVYNRAGKATWTAQNAAELIEEAFPDAASRPELARARVYSGFSMLILADNFCQVTVDGGPPMTAEAAYQAARGHFDEVIAVANAAGREDLRLQALAGRARAALMLGDYQQARDDARAIPEGWRFLAIYSQNSSRENNFVPSHTVARFRKEGGVDPRFFSDPRYAGDPRLAFVDKGPDFKGEDRIRQFVEQSKFPDRDSDMNIASWREARLIEAEAEARMGNAARAVALVNELRTSAGLAPYDGPVTQAAVLEQIFFERSVELFLEAKHLADLRRSGSPVLAGREGCGPVSWEEQQANEHLLGG